MTSRSVEGILPVDKPEGPTSHDVVDAARRALGQRRIGHTGTLDPFASGLLLLCVGRWTRLAQFLTDLDKCYEAVARLGMRTDTEDREGEVISETDAWKDLTPELVEGGLEGLRGDILQVPPRFSAKKIGGVPAHRRARRGEAVALAPRPVTVHELRVTTQELPDVTLRVRCSSGTYVRSLARDFGDALGVGAHLVSLRRTAVGSVPVSASVPMSALGVADRVAQAWIPPLEALRHLARVELSEKDDVEAVAHGRAVAVEASASASSLAAASHGDALVAVGELRDGVFRPRKVFLHE